MSLIQEALRRQQENGEGAVRGSPLRVRTEPAPMPPETPPSPPAENAAGAPPEAPPSPPATRAPSAHALRVARSQPPPLPPPDGAAPTAAAESPKTEVKPLDAEKPAPALLPQPQPQARPLRTVLSVVILLILVVAGATWAVIHGIGSILGGPRDGAVAPVAASYPAAPAAPAAPVAQVVTAPASVTPPVAVATPATNASSAAPAAIPAPPPPPKPVKWPALTLKGVVGQGASGSAIINGEVVGVSEQIAGVTVTAIDGGGVHLECGGEKRFLKVGNAIQ